MSKICRTCLQRTNETMKTYQTLDDLADGLKISAVLRFCIPELYLGLSLNPELCYNCIENLKVSFKFKTKCLSTENIIGNFLKDARCIAMSVDLEDVLAFDNDKEKRQLLDNTCVIQNQNSLRANKSVVGDIREPEVRQSNNHGSDRSIISPHNTNLILQNSGLLNIVGAVNLSQTAIATTEPLKVITPVVSQPRLISPNNLRDSTSSSNDLCKISNVFSLNDCTEEENENLNDFHTVTNSTGEENNIHDIIDIKDEPLDIEESCKNEYSNFPYDEDTVDAFETQCYQNDVGVIENIPEIDNADQYIDIPDFVTINNFGINDLHAFKTQQVTEEPNTSVLPFVKNANVLNQNDMILNEATQEVKLIKVLSNMPEVIYFNNKKLVKHGDAYVEQIEPVPAKIDENKVNNAQVNNPQYSVSKAVASVGNRRKRKLKLVSVNDPYEETTKVDVQTNTDENKIKSVTQASSDNRTDIVVLYTTYSSEGDYINDHDYLIGPYKRNKMLLFEGTKWMCMCYMCNRGHSSKKHASHMKKHGTRCMLCKVNFESPYLLNIHFKSHKKSCRYCSLVLPYFQLNLHELKHVQPRRRRLLPQPKARTKTSTCENGSNANCSIKDKTETYVDQTQDNSLRGVRSKMTPIVGRPRKRKTDEEDKEVESRRVLRSGKRKMYVESDDDEDCKEEGTT